MSEYENKTLEELHQEYQKRSHEVFEAFMWDSDNIKHREKLYILDELFYEVWNRLYYAIEKEVWNRSIT